MSVLAEKILEKKEKKDKADKATLVDPFDIPDDLMSSAPKRVYKEEEARNFLIQVGHITNWLYVDETLMKPNGIFECLYGEDIVAKLYNKWDQKTGLCQTLLEESLQKRINFEPRKGDSSAAAPKKDDKQNTDIKQIKEELVERTYYHSGMHGNNWLAIFGDLEQAPSQIFSLLSRSWVNDFITRNPKVYFCPDALHFSADKKARGEVMSADFRMGCSDPLQIDKRTYVWMTTLLSISHDADIHTAFPLIQTKARKYSVTVVPRPWANYLEASMEITIHKTSDPESRKPKNLELCIFATDYLRHQEIWESGFEFDIFLNGLSFWMIRNPEKSLNLSPLPEGASSVVPDLYTSNLESSKYIPVPWKNYKDFRGELFNYGPRKSIRVCYIQGRCIEIVQCTGHIYNKNAYIVTVRLDEENKIDLDLFVLGKHILDGGAYKKRGEPLSIPAGSSIPEINDLILADVWIGGSIATFLDIEPPPPALVTKDTKPLIFSQGVKEAPVSTTATIITPKEENKDANKFKS